MRIALLTIFSKGAIIKAKSVQVYYIDNIASQRGRFATLFMLLLYMFKFIILII